jgi:PAS domain S-box-containing protein
VKKRVTLRKDGSKFWANIVTTAVLNGEGQLVGFSNVTRDLTRRRRTEEDLKSQRTSRGSQRGEIGFPG